MNTLKRMSKSGLVKLVFCLIGLVTVTIASSGCDPVDNDPGYSQYWIDEFGNIWVW